MLARNSRIRRSETWQAILALLVAAPALHAQYPPIGSIEFYGLRRVSLSTARKALGLKIGESIPTSLAEAEARLQTIPGVRVARLNPVCCEAAKTMLYVGIEEDGAQSPQFRPAPIGGIALPDEIVQANQEFDEAFEQAVLSGDAGDDLSQGHSLMANPHCRAIQERFLAYAARDLALLRAVLHSSADVDQRAMAAWVIGYAPDKRLVVNDLEYALEDPNEEVRNNACRALWAISELTLRKAELGIRISPDPAISLLNSLVWTDRNKASLLIENLSRGREAKLLASLRSQALPALIEIARWKSRGHAMSSFVILGRVAGLSEKEIAEAWDRDDRQFVISAAQRRPEAKNTKRK